MCRVQLVVPDRNRKGVKGRKGCETNEEPRRERGMGIEGKGWKVEQNVPLSLHVWEQDVIC